MSRIGPPRVAEPAMSLALGSPAAQTSGQLTAQFASALDVDALVDGLV